MPPSTLLAILCAGAGLMLQDLTPGNLLVDDEYDGGSGMRLLLSDPGMASETCWLRQNIRGGPAGQR